MCLMLRPTVSVALDCCVCNDCGDLRQTHCISAAKAGKAFDQEGGEEGQSEAWP